MATSKNFIVKNGLEVGGQEVIDSSGVVTSAALGGQTLGTTDSPTFSNLTLTGYLAGPATLTIDPSAVGDNTGTVVIAGNLQVDGTTTTINSTTMTVDDLNITLASGAANAAAADGAGITVDGASATLTYNSTPDAWSFNKSVGIGTTSPTELLTVSKTSSGSITQIASLVNPVGTANTGVRLWMSGTNTTTRGTFIDAVAESTANDHSLRFGTSASSSTPTERMRIDSYGNVSIGTTSGNNKLTVAGTGDGINIQGTGAYLRWNSGDMMIKNEGSYKMGFYTYNATDVALNRRMVIDTDGNVGIGTTSPSAPLDVQGSTGLFMTRTSSGLASYIENENGYGAQYLYRIGGDPKVALRANGYSYFNGGNVGIGTSSPNNLLEVVGGSSTATTTVAQLRSNGSGTYTGTTLKFLNSTDATVNYGSASITAVRTDAGGSGSTDLYFSTANIESLAERMRITREGNVGIGTSSPSNKLIVKRDATTAATTAQIVSENRSGATGQYALYATSLDNGSGSGFYPVVFGAVQTATSGRTADFIVAVSDTDNVDLSTDERLRITSAGKVGIGTTSPGVLTHIYQGASGRAWAVDGNDILAVENNDSAAIDIRTPSTNQGLILFSDNDARSRGVIAYYHAGEYMYFSTGGSESMRIKASGDFIVANTDARIASNYSTQAGLGWYNADSHAEIATTSDRSALEVGRNNANSGAVITIRQQGTSVGMIGTEGGDSLIIQSNGATGAGLRFHPSSANILPVRAGATIDNAIDLGGDTRRFKDLYLSGATKYGTSITYATVAPSSADLVFTANAGQVNVSPNFIFSSSTAGGSIVEHMRINSAGAVGIGTDSPNKKLHVGVGGSSGASNYGVDGIAIEGSGNVGIQFMGGAANQQGLTFSDSSETEAGYVYYNHASNNLLLKAASNLIFNSGGANEKMRLDASGNLLIGTDVASARLYAKTGAEGVITKFEGPAGRYVYSGIDGGGHYMEVAGTQASERVLRIQGNNGSGTYTQLFIDAGNQRIYTSSTANVGIGTATPSVNLQVQGGNSAFAAHFGQGQNNTSGNWGGISLGYNESNIYYRKVGIVAKAIGDNAARQELHFLVDSANDQNSAILSDSKMMIDISGNVGIGTTSPVTQTHIQRSTRVDDAYGLLLVENTYNVSGDSLTNSAVNVKNYHGTSQFMQWEEHGLRIGSRIVTNSGAGDVVFTAGSDSEKMRLKAGGDLLIGVSAAGAAGGATFTVSGSSTDLALYGATTSYGGRIFFGDSSDRCSIQGIYGPGGGGRLTFYTDNTSGTNQERMSITNDGGISVKYNGATDFFSLGGTNTVNGVAGIPSNAGTPLVLARDTGTLRSAHFAGNLKFDDGYGIDFGAVAGSGATSNVLDDYEEGTWTPVLTTTGTAPTGISYTYRSGSYTKIGNVVYVRFGFLLSNVTTAGSGEFKVTGLPFTALNFGPYQEPMFAIKGGGFANASTITNGVFAFFVNSQAHLQFRITNNSDTVLPASEMTSSLFMGGAGFYYVA